jgi:putative two-component system response regulator
MMYKRQADYQLELERKVNERTADLEAAHLDMVKRLAIAAEHRDDDTGEHTRRVAAMAAAISRQLGIDQEEAAIIFRAAPLHDVGKIGIPDSILLKPGRLTPEEFDVMKTHTTQGAEILRDGGSHVLRVAEEIAMNHHERWDGTGYPRGLAGEEIPLVGRIVAVADVFDALTSNRPYKKAWSVREAVGEVNRSAGTQFDPIVVNAFNHVTSNEMAASA